MITKKSFTLTFTVNSDVINCGVTPSTGNVYGKILTFCKTGSTFHCKHTLVSSFFLCLEVSVQRFNVSCVSRFSSISLVFKYEGQSF